jgi:hypothetical protein
MTKKDYVLLTSIVYAHRQYMGEREAREALDHTCALLAEDNIHFNEARFRKECASPMSFVKLTLRKEG